MWNEWFNIFHKTVSKIIHVPQWKRERKSNKNVESCKFPHSFKGFVVKKCFNNVNITLWYFPQCGNEKVNIEVILLGFPKNHLISLSIIPWDDNWIKMFLGYLLGVSKGSQGCLKGFLQVFQRWFDKIKVFRKFKGRFTNITRLFQENFKEFQASFRRGYKRLSWKFWWCYMKASMVFQKVCKGISR